jgi:hypothetical protein
VVLTRITERIVVVPGLDVYHIAGRTASAVRFNALIPAAAACALTATVPRYSSVLQTPYRPFSAVVTAARAVNPAGPVFGILGAGITFCLGVKWFIVVSAVVRVRITTIVISVCTSGTGI